MAPTSNTDQGLLSGPEPGMDPTAAPEWWLTKPNEIRAFLESLPGVEVEQIGHTAGGRPLIAASFGPREMLPGRTSRSLGSAIAARDLTAFYGQGERDHQLLLFVGATHGTELEGTVAALNYLSVLVTGQDLVGRPWPQMAEAGRRHRLVIIPILNVDGRERFADHVHWIGCDPDYQSMVTMGQLSDGKVLHWPEGKVDYPIPRDRMRVLGSYYNDAGFNLVYDSVPGPDVQPETQALMAYCLGELPDCVLFSHSDNGSLVQPASPYTPHAFRQRSDLIGGAVGARCAREGLVKHSVPLPTLYAGDYYCQTDAAYHTYGALPIAIEFPCGWQGVPGTHEAILDIGLTVLDEVAVFGARYRFRP